MTIAMLAFFTSCDDMNEMPTFSDGNVFVAFDKASLSINEDKPTLSIPVTLASVKGVSATVTYIIVDGTAKQGVDFTLADPAATLTFDATNRTQNIVINVINNPGVFTGDLSFTIKLAEEGSVKPSAEKSCVVTIKDLDHPLSSILGNYSVSAESAFGGTVDFTMNIVKDPNDVTVVWIGNIAGIGDGAGFYGVVNEEKTEISVPLGQTSTTDNAGTNGDGKLYLYGYDAPADAVLKEGNMIIKIEDGGATLRFDGITPGLNAGGAGFYEVLLPTYTCSKLK